VMDTPGTMLLILSIVISFHTVRCLHYQYCNGRLPSAPPPTDAPNAGDPTGPLRIGDFIIEGVDRVLVKLSDHVIVFYNELITLMNATDPSWKLIRKERYDQIKEVLIQIRGGEAVSHIVSMSDCCLQGIQPCECKGEGHRWVGNQVFR